MDWGKVIEWLGGQSLGALSLAVAGFAAWQSYQAIKVTRSYQDPVFVMECEPVDWDAYQYGSGVSAQLTLVLINKGNSFAKDVEWSADYDPFHLQIVKQAWPLIEGNGGRVQIPTSVKVDNMTAGELGAAVNRNDASRLCTIKFMSQSGHRVTQKVNLPNPHEYRLEHVPTSEP